MIIEKMKNPWQRVRYSKVYRFPMWILRKALNTSVDKNKEYILPMRLGHKIKLKPSERYLSNIIFNRQYHDPDVYFVERIIPKNGVVLDVGANIGLYTCAFAHHLRNKNVEVYGVEAVRKNYEFLKSNIEINSLSNAHCFHMAVGSERGELSFLVPSEDYVGNLSGNNVMPEEEKQRLKDEGSIEEKVPMVTIDEWAKEQGIKRCDFFKIDIEGAEMFAFQGAREFLKQTRPVVQCEYNKWWLEKNNFSVESFVSFFTEMDYEVFYEQGNQFLPLQSQGFDFSLVDLLFVPKEKVKTLE